MATTREKILDYLNREPGFTQLPEAEKSQWVEKIVVNPKIMSNYISMGDSEFAKLDEDGQNAYIAPIYEEDNYLKKFGAHYGKGLYEGVTHIPSGIAKTGAWLGDKLASGMNLSTKDDTHALAEYIKNKANAYEDVVDAPLHYALGNDDEFDLRYNVAQNAEHFGGNGLQQFGLEMGEFLGYLAPISKIAGLSKLNSGIGAVGNFGQNIARKGLGLVSKNNRISNNIMTALEKEGLNEGSLNLLRTPIDKLDKLGLEKLAKVQNIVRNNLGNISNVKDLQGGVGRKIIENMGRASAENAYIAGMQGRPEDFGRDALIGAAFGGVIGAGKLGWNKVRGNVRNTNLGEVSSLSSELTKTKLEKVDANITSIQKEIVDMNAQADSVRRYRDDLVESNLPENDAQLEELHSVINNIETGIQNRIKNLDKQVKIKNRYAPISETPIEEKIDPKRNKWNVVSNFIEDAKNKEKALDEQAKIKAKYTPTGDDFKNAYDPEATVPFDENTNVALKEAGNFKEHLGKVEDVFKTDYAGIKPNASKEDILKRFAKMEATVADKTKTFDKDLFGAKTEKLFGVIQNKYLKLLDKVKTDFFNGVRSKNTLLELQDAKKAFESLVEHKELSNSPKLVESLQKQIADIDENIKIMQDEADDANLAKWYEEDAQKNVTDLSDNRARFGNVLKNLKTKKIVDNTTQELKSKPKMLEQTNPIAPYVKEVEDVFNKKGVEFDKGITELENKYANNKEILDTIDEIKLKRMYAQDENELNNLALEEKTTKTPDVQKLANILMQAKNNKVLGIDTKTKLLTYDESSSEPFIKEIEDALKSENVNGAMGALRYKYTGNEKALRAISENEKAFNENDIALKSKQYENEFNNFVLEEKTAKTPDALKIANMVAQLRNFKTINYNPKTLLLKQTDFIKEIENILKKENAIPELEKLEKKYMGNEQAIRVIKSNKNILIENVNKQAELIAKNKRVREGIEAFNEEKAIESELDGIFTKNKDGGILKGQMIVFRNKYKGNDIANELLSKRFKEYNKPVIDPIEENRVNVIPEGYKNIEADSSKPTEEMILSANIRGDVKNYPVESFDKDFVGNENFAELKTFLETYNNEISLKPRRQMLRDVADNPIYNDLVELIENPQAPPKVKVAMPTVELKSVKPPTANTSSEPSPEELRKAVDFLKSRGIDPRRIQGTTKTTGKEDIMNRYELEIKKANAKPLNNEPVKQVDTTLTENNTPPETEQEFYNLLLKDALDKEMQFTREALAKSYHYNKGGIWIDEDTGKVIGRNSPLTEKPDWVKKVKDAYGKGKLSDEQIRKITLDKMATGTGDMKPDDFEYNRILKEMEGRKSKPEAPVVGILPKIKIIPVGDELSKANKYFKTRNINTKSIDSQNYTPKIGAVIDKYRNVIAGAKAYLIHMGEKPDEFPTAKEMLERYHALQDTANAEDLLKKVNAKKK